MSQVPNIEFNALSDRKLEDAFVEKSITGDWIAFHGTSSVNESEIDHTGIGESQIFTEEEITNLVSIYQSINWYGRSWGGFNVLAAFTWQRTIGLRIRPIYLSDYPERCLLYSTKDFAGGETARAIRHAIEDLADYLTNDELRKDHYNSQRYQCEDLVSKGANPTPVIQVNLDWLRSKLADLESLRNKASEIRYQHRWGIVYAIRFSPADLQWLESGGSEGIQYFGVIPPGKIAAKARVYNLTEEIAMRRKQSADRLLLESGRYFTGLRTSVKKAGLQTAQMASPLNLFDRRTMDPQAGVDVSAQIATQLGMNSNADPQDPKNRF
jgi:hypothetical protein